jgi:lysozyme
MIEAARVMLKRNEGVRHRVYKCTQGYPTIGVGFNLARADARTRCARHGLDYEGLLTGAKTLTAAQVDALLDEDIVDCLKQMPEGFDSMPMTAQLVLVDMCFQLGAAGLRSFKNTLKAFADRNWKKAAANMRLSLAYRQTPKRWESNAKLLEAIP